MHIKTEQHHSEGILEDVVTMDTDTDLNKHEMNLALNRDVKLHVEYNCPKYDNHVTIKTEPRSPNSVNMGHLMADTDENLTGKSENQFIDMLEDNGNKVVKLESSLPDFDKNEMLKKEPDSSEYITDTEVNLPSEVFQQTANMMHIHHSTEPSGTSTNTLSLYKPGIGKQENRHVETGNGMPSLPITDTTVPENNNACTKTFTLFKPETGEVLIIKAEMNASIIESETEAGAEKLLEGESIVKEIDFEAAKTSKTHQREMKPQKSRPTKIRKMGYLLKEGEHFKIREDGVFKYKCLLCGKIFQYRNQFEKHAQTVHFKLPCYVDRSRLRVMTPEETWPCVRRMTSETDDLPDTYDVKITKKTESDMETSFVLYNLETKESKKKEIEYTKVCDQVQGHPEKEKTQIGRPVFMYNQETGELQKVEIEIGTSRTSNGKEIRNSRFSNSKEIGTNRPSDGKALEAQSAFQNLLINKMINRCITDDRKQENIFPIKNSGLPEEYNPSHTVSTASIADDDDGPCHTTIEDHVILVEDSNRSIKEQIQEIKEKNWHKYNYACGNCTSAFPRMIDLIKHHNTCEREVTTFHAKKSKSQVESVDFVQNGTNMLPCSDWLKHKSKGESDVTCDINAMNSNSQVENVDIPQKGRKRKIEKKHPYSCSVCKTTFSTVNSLLQHKNECESDQFKKEEEKEDHKSEKMNTNYRHLITQFKLSKNVHFEIIKTGFGVVRCILCGEKNECFEDFSLHAKSKHFPYQCLVCPAFFANMDDLWQHSVACVYIKGQGYCCPVCRKILYSSKHLRVHCEENHTVYICFLCNSEFKDQKTLDLHRQTCS